ncbi:murein biosynthesis integral membrane protein MurJ [Gordonia sp. DT30]|uniref:murein biosynthesis integral membrane protein MurJ n=1 Tax=Gordonia sp. DT30 TaxID=3416546 RepID=UPI003CEAE934
MDRNAEEFGDADTAADGLARDSDSSIMRTSGSIALATLISRITGFVRTVLILALLGASVASAFQAADVLPNMIAEILLGAVLTAIVIPLLARAEAEDPDGGTSFINKIFTLTVVVLGIGTIAAIAAAPLLTQLNIDNASLRPVATGLAYFLLIEILFYGLTALFTAILNLRGYFKPGAWAPVLNNVVQIGALLAYWAMPGQLTLNPFSMSDPQLLVLGIGCALGVVLQAAILLPYLRRAGIRLRLEWGLDARLRRFGNMALAIVSYVAILQVGLVITYRIASAASDAGISVYVTHWQLLQLPYGVLGVTILTAIMPRLSRNAAAGDTKAVVDDLSLATRLSMVALVPVVAYMTFFGTAIGVAVFNFGRFDAHVASQLGSTLAWGAFTLIPYAMTLVQLRVFYAREDAWTPTLMVLGITAVKIVTSYLGPVLFSDPDLVVRWLAMSNGFGYLVGAIVGHYLLRSRLRADTPGHQAPRLTNVTFTTVVTLAVSIAVTFAVWLVAEVSGLHLATQHGKFGSIAYLVLTAVVVLGVTYAGLAAAGLPDVVSLMTTLRRVAGRFVPALAPRGEPDKQPSPTITVQFPRVISDESLPYSGQVQVVRRFDRGSATWQSYAVHTGGAAGGTGVAPWSPPSRPPDIRYRRRGVRRVNETGVDASPEPTTTPATSTPHSADGGRPGAADAPTQAVDMTESSAPQPDPTNSPSTERAADTQADPNLPDSERPDPERPDPDRADPIRPPRRRGPRLVPGAAVAGGRYRLLEHHGGTRGLQFWKAQDVNLDREVGLTFVDSEQLAPLPDKDVPTKAGDSGPQAVLTRTLRLGQISSSGVARVLDVVRGSSGGIVVAEWVQGSSLADVAATHPSPIGAARAVRALAAAAEAAHRSGGALSIDHPDRIRISSEGNAVLAFPGTLAGDDAASDVRGLGAVLYALLLQRWPLDGANGSALVTTATTRTPVGGLAIAAPAADGDGPIEPREVDPEIPFEISAVAARALSGTRGIRTAATVQHVLDQATVVDLKTDMIPALGDSDEPPVSITAPSGRIGSDEPDRSNRTIALLVGAALLVLLVVVALVVWLTGIFGGGDENTDINQFLSTSTSAPARPAPASAPAPAPAAGGPIALQSAALVDYSGQSGDSPDQARSVINGAGPGWRSDNYRTAAFGNLKQGLGLMVDLGSAQAAKTVTITTTTPGFGVSLRSASSPDATLAQTTELTSGTVNQPTTTLTIPNPQPSRYLLVWITSLPGSAGNYQVQVSKIAMTR